MPSLQCCKKDKFAVPQVSIITALHNKGSYVAETIQSVLAQTISDLELIVVENGSTDNGPEIVRQFSDTRIRLVVSPKCGPGAARNFGLDLATGEWILFLDADDLIESDYLQQAIKCANRANADMVISRWQKFLESPAKRLEEEKSTCEGRIHAQVLDSAIVFTPWPIHAALVKHRILARELWWPEQMDGYLGEDTVFWFRLLTTTCNWVCHPVVGALYRWKTPDCRTQNEDVGKWFEGLHKCACENVRLLAERGIHPTPTQAENLMRLYEGLYKLARQKENRMVEKESIKYARQWLIRCLDSSWLRPALLGRRLLGFRVFNLIKQCVRSQN